MTGSGPEIHDRVNGSRATGSANRKSGLIHRLCRWSLISGGETPFEAEGHAVSFAARRACDRNTAPGEKVTRLKAEGHDRARFNGVSAECPGPPFAEVEQSKVVELSKPITGQTERRCRAVLRPTILCAPIHDCPLFTDGADSRVLRAPTASRHMYRNCRAVGRTTLPPRSLSPSSGGR